MGVLAQLGVGLLVVLILKYQRTNLLLQSLEDVEEGGHYHDLAKHTYQHTSDSCAIPVRLLSRANCTIKMAFLANRPINIINAICI